MRRGGPGRGSSGGPGHRRGGPLRRGRWVTDRMLLHAPDHEHPAPAAVFEADTQCLTDDEHPEPTAAEADEELEDRTTRADRPSRRMERRECAHGGTSCANADVDVLVGYENVSAQGAMGSIGVSTIGICGLMSRLHRSRALATNWSRRPRATSACRCSRRICSSCLDSCDAGIQRVTRRLLPCQAPCPANHTITSGEESNSASWFSVLVAGSSRVTVGKPCAPKHCTTAVASAIACVRADSTPTPWVAVRPKSTPHSGPTEV